jgi:hypothetical protein
MKKFKYDYAELWFSALYTSMYTSIPNKKEIQRRGEQLATLFNSHLDEINKGFGSACDPIGKVTYKSSLNYIVFPQFDVLLDGRKINVKIRVNPCTGPDRLTKIIIIPADTNTIDSNEVQKFFIASANLCELGLKKITELYFECSKNKHEDPKYKIFIRTAGSSNEVVHSIIESSSSMDDLKKVYETQDEAKTLIKDLSEWGYRPNVEYQKWFRRTILPGGEGNFAFTNNEENRVIDFKGLLYGKYDFAHKLTQNIESDLVRLF